MAEAEAAASKHGEARDTDRLVRGLRRADPAAQAELCDAFGSRIARYLASRLGARADAAEDLMIQTLVEASRSIARFDPRKATFAAWVFGIARRQAQIESRRQRRRRAVPAIAQTSLDSAGEQPAPGDLAEGAASRLEAKRQVSILVGYLSEIEMEVLVLRCLHQLSVKEIAQVLGRSDRAIDSLLHRAKRKARERLADDAGAV
jgi:RNA polymerase sigma factor (sigma-70 family)